MQTTIQKWGNSLALRIPKAFTDSLARLSEKNYGRCLCAGAG